MQHYLTSLLAALLLLVPVAVVAAPGDSAPPPMDDDDDDDEGPGDAGPSDEDEADEDEDEAEDEEEPAPDEDSGDDAEADSPDQGDDLDEDDADQDDAPEAPSRDDELDLPELEEIPTGEADDEEARSGADQEESEADLDDRYRVEVPGEEDEAEKPARARDRAAASGGEVELPEERKRRGLVKVIQKKFFLKYRRLELTPGIGYVGNDNFIRRLAIGIGATYHVNDIFSLELLAYYLPNLGQTDYKAITLRLRNEEEVVPDISRVTFLGTLGVQISPIYGKLELGTLRIINYDIYVVAGAGVAASRDDTEIIQSPCNDLATVRERNAAVDIGCQYVDQVHFVTNVGAGFRVVFNEWIGVKLDARQYTHIEQVYRDGDIGLEMKQNLMLSIGASFFLPPKARALPL